MKSVKSLLVAVLAVTFVAFISSCGGGMKKDIAQRWMMSPSQDQTDTMNAQKARMEASLKSLDDSITAAGKDTTKAKSFKDQKEMAQMMMDNMTKGMDAMKSMWMDFNSDGTFTSNMGGDMKGKWSIMESDKKLVISKDGEDKGDTINIVDLTKDKMTLAKGKDSKDVMTFVPATGDAAAKVDSTK